MCPCFPILFSLFSNSDFYICSSFLEYVCAAQKKNLRSSASMKNLQTLYQWSNNRYTKKCLYIYRIYNFCPKRPCDKLFLSQNGHVKSVYLKNNNGTYYALEYLGSTDFGICDEPKNGISLVMEKRLHKAHLIYRYIWRICVAWECLF